MKHLIPPAKYNLKFTHTISRWDEGLPLGNGRIGALIWGPSRALRFSLDRTDIWDTTPCPAIQSADFTYQTMTRLARKGNESEIRRIFDAPYHHITPCKLPAGKLILDLNEEHDVTSCLSLSNAEAVLMAGEVRVEAFLHAEEKMGFIRINRPLSAFTYTVENPEYGYDGAGDSTATNSLDTASLKQLSYPMPLFRRGNNAQWFIQELNNGFSYGVFVCAREIPGGAFLAFRVAASTDSPEWESETLAELNQALGYGFDALLLEHSAWWAEFWNKSGISLPDKLFERNWYLTNYLLASCSRKGGYPMPLQGLWTADDGRLPPWKGDYHHDLNTQLSYYSYLKANHLEEGECFLDFLWSLRDCAHRFAQSFYNAEGLCLPSVMSINGVPLGGWGMYALSPTNQIWLCQAFERHYRFTGDRDFLRERAYPYFRETAECILSLLEERNGLYYLPISSSPEIHDDTIAAFLSPNSNYDLALMRYLFTQLICFSQEVGDQDISRWKEALEHLPSLAVDEKGCLLLSPDEGLAETHRHHSHLMAIHPLRLITPDSEEGRRIIDASLLDQERLGTGCWVGYSFAWAAELYAVQRNGNGAASRLRAFWADFCSPNGFHLNGDYQRRGSSMLHYRPFTLEGNMCAVDALQEMLLQTENGVIDLFPAIPEEWREPCTAFSGFRAEGGVVVSAELRCGRITALKLENMKGKLVRLRKSPMLDTLAIKCGWLSDGPYYVVEGKQSNAIFRENAKGRISI